jgi:hypothetical protein
MSANNEKDRKLTTKTMQYQIGVILTFEGIIAWKMEMKTKDFHYQDTSLGRSEEALLYLLIHPPEQISGLHVSIKMCLISNSCEGA